MILGNTGGSILSFIIIIGTWLIIIAGPFIFVKIAATIDKKKREKQK